jgi:ABC-2 type transport system ATP-binding protein
LYSDLYIEEYLEIVARIYKVTGLSSRIKDMMRLTRLESEKNKKIGALSKGFRQRVGLAQALIHDPPVLILDEPTNGLDPNQLGEIRALIHEISKEKTVLLSSHILQEIETICGRVVIINHGKLVADSDLLHLKEIKMNRNQQVFVEFSQPVALSALMTIHGVEEIVPEAGGWLISALSGEDVRPAIFRFAVESGLILLAMAERQQNLENIFRQLTKE